MTTPVLTITGTVNTMPDMTGMVPPEYGRWLARQRETLGLTQRALAELIDVTVTTIARYEGGFRRPHEDTKATIARVLDERRRQLGTSDSRNVDDQPEAAAV